MLKTMIKLQNKMVEFKEIAAEKINNKDGFTAMEWLLIGIVIAGLIVVFKPLLSASATKFAGLWDTIVVEKINSLK